MLSHIVVSRDRNYILACARLENIQISGTRFHSDPYYFLSRYGAHCEILGIAIVNSLSYAVYIKQGNLNIIQPGGIKDQQAFLGMRLSIADGNDKPVGGVTESETAHTLLVRLPGRRR